MSKAVSVDHRETYGYAHVCNEVGQGVANCEDGQANDSVRKSKYEAERLQGGLLSS
jgi:hypothetical protein